MKRSTPHRPHPTSSPEIQLSHRPQNSGLDTRDQVTTAGGVLPTTPIALVGAIGRALLDALLPARHQRRTKARTRKNPTSKYGPNVGRHPSKAQRYTVSTEVAIFEEGLAPRPRR